MHPVAKSLNNIAAELNSQFLQRRDTIEACVLALLAGEHGFILGPPGTAKSELIRALVERVIGANYFETLLSRTRPEAAVLGPYNLPQLREKGDYRRKTDGFLPTADIAMLDEVGKMSPILGHDLLAILNERVLHEVNGARSAHPVPLSTCFTASNEMLTNDSEDAAALWDRLLVRCIVDYLQETSDFVKLLTLKPAPITATVEWVDLKDAIANEVPHIGLDRSAIDAMVKLKKQLLDSGIAPSDRRWRWSTKVLKSAAFLAGRDVVTDDDLGALRFTLWDTVEQIQPVERAATSVANPMVEKLNKYKDQLTELNTGIKKRDGKAMDEKSNYAIEVNSKLKTIRGDLDNLVQDCKKQGRATTRVEAVIDTVNQVQREVWVKLLDMDPNHLPR